jgi:serine/threonine-protein kinase
MSDTLLDARPDPLVGQLVGARYRVVRELGSGGMAVVYEGEHEDLGRRVAIKVIRHELVAHAPDAVDRFLQEARTASRLQHPSVVDVFDLGRLDDGRPFMVMPLLKGMDLERMLRERGPRPPAEVAKLLAGPAAALDAMHAQGIVHRDIKLENLFLERHDDGHEAVRLMDFGLAAMAGHGSRMTRDGMVLGTPHYMAPEVARGNKAKAAADIYGLATLAYELMAGVLPFDDDEPVRLMATKLVQDPPLLSSHVASSPELDAVFVEALARDPERRPKTCGALIERLVQVTTERATTEKATTKKRLGTAEADALFDGPSPVERRGEARPVTGLSGAVGTEAELDSPEEPTEAARPAARSRGTVIAIVAVLLLALGGGTFWMTRGEATVASAEVTTEASTEATPPEPTPTEPTNVAPEPTPAEVSSEPAEPVVAAPVAPVAPTRPRPSPREASPTSAMTTSATATDTTTTSAMASSMAAPTTSEAPTTESAMTSDDALARAQELNREAQAFAMRGLLPAAIEKYREATLLAPRYPVPWRGLGIAHERLRQNAEAKRAFERYLQLAPNAADSALIRERAAAL